MTSEDGPRLSSRRELMAFEDLWIIPNSLKTTRSKLYSQVKTDSIKELLLESFRLPSATSFCFLEMFGGRCMIGDDVLFEEFWTWCSACDYGVDEGSDIVEELEWLLWKSDLLCIPHADSPNVIVRSLPTVISDALDYEIFKHGAAVMCPVCNIEAGQILKRDYLPRKRTKARISRLLTLVGDQPDRWAHLSELEGLRQLDESSTPLTSSKLDTVKPIAERSESRPLAAMTEFTPKIQKVFTDYPGIKENLNLPSFEIVDSFSLSNILFAANPVDSFNSLGQRFVNQFPKESTLLNPRSLLHSIRGEHQEESFGEIDSSNLSKDLFPSWFPLSFDLKTEVKWFLEANKDENKEKMWLMIAGEAGVFDWCLTSQSKTVVKYMEANSDNWVVQKQMPDPMLIKGKKFMVCLFLLVRSFQPLQAFLYNKVTGRIAEKEYTTKAEFLGDEGVHLPFENPYDEMLAHNDLVQVVEEAGLEWEQVFLHLTEIVGDMLRSIESQIGPSQRSRALYRLDFHFPQVQSAESFQPEFSTVAFAPHIDVPLSENPHFVNQLFEILFLHKTHQDLFVGINDGTTFSELESCTSSESS